MSLKIVDGAPLMPTSVDALLAASLQEGIRNVSRLVREWNSGQTLFDEGGECLLIAQADGLSIGVGGVLKCRVVPTALRVSRFYVRPEWRQKGVASMLAKEAISHAFRFAEVITCNAQASEIAGPFWESLGFAKSNIAGLTHTLAK